MALVAVMMIGFAASICAGLVFIVSAAAKLRHRATLAGVVSNYRLLPGWAVVPVAVALPWAEGATGIALIAGERQVAPFVGAALLVVFGIGMAVNIMRGRSHIDCGCGLGGLREPLHTAFVVRNLLLAAALLTNLLGRSLAAADTIVAAVAGLAAFLLIILLNALLALPNIRPQQA